MVMNKKKLEIRNNTSAFKFKFLPQILVRYILLTPPVYVEPKTMSVEPGDNMTDHCYTTATLWIYIHVAYRVIYLRFLFHFWFY
jgi:hypothetical protein